MIPGSKRDYAAHYLSMTPTEYIPRPLDSPLVCTIHGVPVTGHPRCVGCEILIGSGHQEVIADADGRCSYCQWLATRRAWRLAEMEGYPDAHAA